MRIEVGSCQLRSYPTGDAEAIAAAANNRSIWRNMHYGFPHPFTHTHARTALALQ